ncbi:Vanillate O-demethylase oxidoreductase [Paraburkholderia ginsengiterrae]|uniref:Vanillate O-demethylase oxidoreductase n=1 Tax=Paraburkholderia ginsengiterrae TaxID=1462993 RepID=A0A1A9N0Z9_9BURK|nr:PDR/VanB family oxidoreductase [Paraburkholderia ginsengiterrae]OAJ53676.1 Vanillate O-demethylase oxidoreductase [Paraburkholderia ginsengiterrae]OAJ54337.1 Vanillate O-demethylase oxidoreductase [Paraburkholderia ginsengiterrae]
MDRLAVRVTRKKIEAENVVSLELTSIGGQSLPAFSAGSHIDIVVRDGIVRQYSLCNAPTERHRYVIGVLRDPYSRGGSMAIHDAVVEGTILHISEPKNHFALKPARRSLLLAGGIGVTPIICMAEQLTRIGADFEMHYCTRSLERTAFHQRIIGSPFSDRVSFHFGDGPAPQRLNLPLLLGNPESDIALYVCGPGGFIDSVIKTAENLGWQGQQIIFERFGALTRSSASDVSFEVKVASSGKIITIAGGKTIVAVLAEHGVDVPVSCEQGVCGTCVTRVLAGTPDHQDLYFTDEEHAKNDQMTLCCSRSKSALLVLDL